MKRQSGGLRRRSFFTTPKMLHPLELKLFDRLIEYAALVQLPIVPLIDPSSRWVAGSAARCGTIFRQGSAHGAGRNRAETSSTSGRGCRSASAGACGHMSIIA
jgi:hypothetical protein